MKHNRACSTIVLGGAISLHLIPSLGTQPSFVTVQHWTVPVMQVLALVVQSTHLYLTSMEPATSSTTQQVVVVEVVQSGYQRILYLTSAGPTTSTTTREVSWVVQST